MCEGYGNSRTLAPSIIDTNPIPCGFNLWYAVNWLLLRYYWNSQTGDAFMKSGLLCLLALVSIALRNAPLWAQGRDGGHGDQEARKNGWIFSLDEGITQAEKTGKPLMVVFRCVP